MNRKKLYISIIIFAFLLLVMAVGFIIIKKNYNSNRSNISGDNNKTNVFLDYDFSNDFNDTSYIFLTESSECFFLFLEYSNNIYTISKKTGLAEIICKNPQCTHTDNTCSACLMYPENSTWLNYYNERLYYLCSLETSDELLKEEWLMSMDLDGKDRKKEIKVNDVIVNSDSGWALSMATYGNEIYLAKNYKEPDENNILRNMGTEIYKIDLASKEMIKIYEKSQEGTYSYIATKKGNMVYFGINNYNQDADGEHNKSVLAYDENTRNITEEETGRNVFVGISENNKYYSTPNENEGRILVKKSDSQEYEEVLNLGKDGTQCAIDIYDNYIIVNNWPVRNMKKEDRNITIYDTEGNFIKKISTYGYTLDTKIANGFLFIEKENEDGKYDICVCPIATDTDTWTKLN